MGTNFSLVEVISVKISVAILLSLASVNPDDSLPPSIGLLSTL